MSDLQRAKNFLAQRIGEEFTPERIKEWAYLGISISTLAPKLRLYTRQGELIRRYHDNGKGKMLAFYSYNPERLIAKVQYRRQQDQQTIQQGLF